MDSEKGKGRGRGRRTLTAGDACVDRRGNFRLFCYDILRQNVGHLVTCLASLSIDLAMTAVSHSGIPQQEQRGLGLEAQTHRTHQQQALPDRGDRHRLQQEFQKGRHRYNLLRRMSTTELPLILPHA